MPKKTLKKPVKVVKEESSTITTNTLPPSVMPFAKKQAASNGGRFIITDKGTKKTYYGTINKDGSVTVNSYEVLTGKNDNPKAGLSRYADPSLEQTEKEDAAGNHTNQTTPLGTFKPKINPNIYGSPALNYTTDAKNSSIYVHKTYPGEYEKRTKLYNNKNLADNAASYGCINGKCGDVNKMIEFFKEGDLAYIIDTRLPEAQNMQALEQNKYFHNTVDTNTTVPKLKTPLPAPQKLKPTVPVNQINKLDKTPITQKPKTYEDISLNSKEPNFPYTPVDFPKEKTDYSVDLKSIGFSKDFFNPTQFLPNLQKLAAPNTTPIQNKAVPNTTWSAQKLPTSLGGGLENPGGNSYVPSIEDVAEQKAKDLSFTMESKTLDPNILNYKFNSNNNVTQVPNLQVSNTQLPFGQPVTSLPNINPKVDSQVYNNTPKNQSAQTSSTADNVKFELPELTDSDLFPVENTGWNLNNFDNRKILDINNKTEPQKQIVQKTYSKNPYTIPLLNVFNFGLNSIAENHRFNKLKKEEDYNSIINNQPNVVSYNKRQLRGDDQMFAGEGGEKGKTEKPRKPIYVSDKNDPRLKSYNDSLNLYKAYQKQDELMGNNNTAYGSKVKDYIKKNPMKSTDWTTNQLKERRKANIPFKHFDGTTTMISEDFKSKKDMLEGRFASKEDEKLIKYYKFLGFTDDEIMYHTSPDVVSDKIRPIGNYYDGAAISPQYKKPVQPIIFEDPKKLAKQQKLYEENKKAYESETGLSYDKLVEESIKKGSKYNSSVGWTEKGTELFAYKKPISQVKKETVTNNTEKKVENIPEPIKKTETLPVEEKSKKPIGTINVEGRNIPYYSQEELNKFLAYKPTKVGDSNNYTISRFESPLYFEGDKLYDKKTKKQVFKFGGEKKLKLPSYKEGGEYELDEKEINRLKKLGYEFE